jgi:hypothetical protein
MTRTPTTTVTAITFAACAFAWGRFLGGRLSGMPEKLAESQSLLR